MTDELLYEVTGHVGVIRFNRPERMNTITPVMLDALSKRLVEADRDPAVRVIVITGNGRAWCAGLDVGAAASGEGITQTVRRGLELVAAGRAYEELRRLRGKVRLGIDLEALREDR